MYPFRVILVGNDEQLLPNVRRELLNQWAEIETEIHDMTAAIEQLSLEHDDARLFVIHVNDISQLDNFKRLCRTFPGRPILVLMTSDADPSCIVNAIRNGASQVVMLPLKGSEFADAMDCIMVQFGHLASHTRVIAVTAGHGGAGVTSTAVNLAYALAQKYHRNTILAELSLNVGQLLAFLQIQPKHTTEELFQMGHSVDCYAIKKALVPFGENLSILAGPLHVKAPIHVEDRVVTYIIQNLRHMADIVILDVPSTMDDFQMEILRSADKVVLVTEQTIPSLHMTGELLRLGLRAKTPSIVINRYDSTMNGFDVEHLKKHLETDELLTITDDNVGFHSALNGGQPLRLVSSKSKALIDVDAIAEQIIELSKVDLPCKSKEGIFSRLTHLLGVG